MGRHPRVADGAAVEAFLVVAVGHSLKGAITRADGSEGPLGRRGSRVVGDAWDTVDGQRTGAVEGMNEGAGDQDLVGARLTGCWGQPGWMHAGNGGPKLLRS